jgi:carbamoyltransferase
VSVILGLNAYHADSAACLVVDGKLVAAAEEERFRRMRHWAGLPTQAIDYCLREARLRLGDIDHIAINRKPGMNNVRRLQFIITHFPHPKLVWQRFNNMRSTATLQETLARAYGIELKARVHHVEHHLAHLASAFFLSGFSEAACVSLDGFGDFASTAVGFGKGKKIQIASRVYFPHSLGTFYSAMTQYIGFPHYGDEEKMMDLAPYGEPNFLEAMREIVRIQPDGTFRLNLKYFRHHVGDASYTWNDCTPSIGLLYRQGLTALLGPPRQANEPLEQRHKDIARSTQAMYEKALFSLLAAVHKQYRCDNLTLAGGCIMNTVANGKVYRRTPFKTMYLPAAAGDAGGAIGAAAYVFTELAEPAPQQSTNGGANSREPESALSDNPNNMASDRPDENIQPLAFDIRNSSSVFDLRSHGRLEAANLGPDSTAEELHALIDWKKKEIAMANCSLALLAIEEELLGRTAQAIANGKIVGWFQGRMEWGPHALGNRSILADPRKAEIKEILNLKIKHREAFRPFAAAILRESVSEWFEQDDDVPFMMEVFQVRPTKRAFVPAITHVDGSSRLQTVDKESNGRYYRLIENFRELTGVPLLLTTSFSENEPLVCYPEEALDCFLRTNMDVLVLGQFLIEKGR